MESFSLGTIGCWGGFDTGPVFRSRPAAPPEPHSSLDTLTIDNFGLPSMCSSSLLSLISLHLTGPDEEATPEPGLEPVSEVVILIFLTVPNPEIGALLDAGVADAEAKLGAVGDSDSGESALELDRELSEESLDEVGLILSRSPPSMRKCWSRMELQVCSRRASFVE